jgi:hypothetical protein
MFAFRNPKLCHVSDWSEDRQRLKRMVLNATVEHTTRQRTTCLQENTPPPTLWRNSHQCCRASALLRLHDHTPTHTLRAGRTPLDE